MATYDEMGREVPDGRPVSVPHNWQRPLSLHEEIKRFVRQELSARAADEGEESFEEADDFEVDEDPDLFSPYELRDAPVEAIDKDADPPVAPEEKKAPEAEKAP